MGKMNWFKSRGYIILGIIGIGLGIAALYLGPPSGAGRAAFALVFSIGLITKGLLNLRKYKHDNTTSIHAR